MKKVLITDNLYESCLNIFKKILLYSAHIGGFIFGASVRKTGDVQKWNNLILGLLTFVVIYRLTIT